MRLQAGHKYCLLGRLSSEVGWNHYDTIRVSPIIILIVFWGNIIYVKTMTFKLFPTCCGGDFIVYVTVASVWIWHSYLLWRWFPTFFYVVHTSDIFLNPVSFKIVVSCLSSVLVMEYMKNCDLVQELNLICTVHIWSILHNPNTSRLWFCLDVSSYTVAFILCLLSNYSVCLSCMWLILYHTLIAGICYSYIHCAPMFYRSWRRRGRRELRLLMRGRSSWLNWGLKLRR